MYYPITILQNSKMRLCFLTTLVLLCFTPVERIRAQSDNSSDAEQFLAIKNILQAGVDSLNKAEVIKAKYAFQPYAESDNKELKTLAYYYMGYADYRLNLLFPEVKEDQKEKFLNEAVEYLEKAAALDSDFSDAHALLSSAYGMKAAGVFSGMKYGPKADNAIEKALNKGPENPRAHMLHAVGLQYKPSMFGGSTEGAIKGFKKAAELFKTFQPKNELMPDWGHAEVYAWLGQAYEQNEEYSKAKTAYQQALKVDPSYGWVKYKLMPELAGKRE
jgi:tetratricopeptide (TPR) repeat protein